MKAIASLTWLLLSFGLIDTAGAVDDRCCANLPPQTTAAVARYENQSALNAWRALRRERGRKDPVFSGPDMYTPLLFAHRGGGLETVESTERGFRYALEVGGADVLELDVQITRDGRFVVWHGPRLDNVFILGVDSDSEKRPPGRRHIYDFDWRELDGRAWVANPCSKDLSDVPRQRDRRLLLLSDFLRLFKDAPLNIEMKGTFKMALGGREGLQDNVAAFRKILLDASHRPTIIIASVSKEILSAFRTIDGDHFPTNFTFWEQIKLKVSKTVPKRRVLETSYWKILSGQKIIQKMHRSNSATYVFITGFGPIEALDCNIEEAGIIELLSRGVDGIMTDRPRTVRQIMHQWLQKEMGNP